MTAKSGTPYIPDLLHAIADRYSFQKFPVSFEEIASETRIFQMGKWNNLQIDELGIYNDGVIAAAPSSTDVTNGIVDDLFNFVIGEYDFEITSRREFRHYESAIVIELPKNITNRFLGMYELSRNLTDFQVSYDLPDYKFETARLGSFVDATLHTGRIPLGFSLERRAGESFKDNRWYSSAPLKTEDHLTLLDNLEQSLS